MSLASRAAAKHISRPQQMVKQWRMERRGRTSNTLLSSASELVRQTLLAGKRRRSQVFSRFRPAHIALSNREPRRAAAITHQILGQGNHVPPRMRPSFCVLAVYKFLRAGDWDRAFSVYQRMKAEGIAGQAEALTVLLARSIKLPSAMSKLDYAIRDIPKTLDHVEEFQLIAILSHLVRGKADIYTIREFLNNARQKMGEKWKPSWETCALMVQAEAQAGYDLAAKEWFVKAKRRIGELEQRHVDVSILQAARQQLYTKLIIGSAAFMSNRPIFFNRILHQMKDDGVVPSRRIFNFYIQRYAQAGRVERSFAFYRSMRHSNPPIQADHHTFYSLFSGDSSKTSSYWSLDFGGRRLFRDMTRQHLSNTDHRPQTQSNVITTAVLNAALRHFMRKRDYAAATVTMRTFPVCCILPNLNTQNTIINGLLARIKEELTENPSRTLVLWSDRILGEVVRLWKGIWAPDIAAKLCSTVERGSRRSRSNGVDLLFLIGLLRRAMLAALNRWPGKDPEVDKYVFKRVMNGAQASMLPPKAADTTGWFMV
jgi:pentatricopeptide repeat protein